MASNDLHRRIAGEICTATSSTHTVKQANDPLMTLSLLVDTDPSVHGCALLTDYGTLFLH